MKTEKQILDYCYDHLDVMWASYIASIILGIDFREVTKEKIDKYKNETNDDVFKENKEIKNADIYSSKGTKVKFTAHGGYDYEQIEAKKLLKLGEFYTLKDSVVHGFSTDFYLEGFEQPFNSCLFEQD